MMIQTLNLGKLLQKSPIDKSIDWWKSLQELASLPSLFEFHFAWEKSSKLNVTCLSLAIDFPIPLSDSFWILAQCDRSSAKLSEDKRTRLGWDWFGRLCNVILYLDGFLVSFVSQPH